MLVALSAIALLAGCATTAVDENFGAARQIAADRLGADLKWLTTDEAREQGKADVDALLQKPLSMDDAVRISLAYSPALQAMLFDAASVSAQATQSARLPNPVFAFERLVRGEGDERELEIGRVLSLSVFDLLALPARVRLADARQQQVRLQTAREVVRTALDARQTWVRAVAAEQALKYLTMDFNVAHAALLQGLKPGASVAFEFVERQPGEWVITSIKAAAAAAVHAGH